MNMNVCLIVSVLCFLALTGCAVEPTSTQWFDDVLNPSAGRFGGVFSDPEAHRVQILVSEVVEHADRPATLKRYRYRLGEAYFYPASSIKIAGCVAALLEVQRRREATGLPISADTPLLLYPRRPEDRLQTRDDSNVVNGTITLHQEIRKICFASSNEGYNRLYDFVGRDRLNQLMWDAGLTSFRLHHRLSAPGDEAWQRWTPQIDMVLDNQTVTIPERTAELELPATEVPGSLLLGDRYYDWDGRLVEEPFDFSTKNYVSVEDLQDMMIMLARPKIDLGKAGFALTDVHRALLQQALSQDATESRNPVYTDPGVLAESSALPGVIRVVPRPAVFLMDKTGQAYGFQIENSYFLDRSTGASFFLTAVVYANPNRTLNDNEYGYDRTDRFMADLGQAVAQKLWVATARQ